MANLTPGPKEPLHRVLTEEINQIVALAKRQEYVDLSHRILAVTAWDQGLFQASFSTVYRVLKERNLMTARGPGGAHNGHSKAPLRKDLTGPNQRWCWDISYLMTFQKGEYLYLYLLLDEWSRKRGQFPAVVPKGICSCVDAQTGNPRRRARLSVTFAKLDHPDLH